MYPSVFLQSPVFSRNFDRQISNPYGLPLFLPLQPEAKANILLPDYHIQKLSGFFLYFSRGVDAQCRNIPEVPALSSDARRVVV